MPRSTTHRRFFLLVGFGAAVVFVPAGCSVFSKPSVVPESVIACRQYARQGCSAIDRGEWDRAEHLLRQAVEASPIDHAARHQFAEVLWQRGATAEAIRQLEIALRLAPGDVSLAVRAGEMHLALGKARQAMTYADYAIAAQPDLAPAWALRGRAHATGGNLAQGLADLHRALGYAPSANDVLLDIATIYYRRGEPERCLTTIHHVFDLHPPGEEPQQALFLEGVALSELGRFTDAAHSLYAAARRGPPRTDVLYHLAEAEFRSGRSHAALSAARSALATDARHEPTISLLAKLGERPGEDGIMEQ